MGETCARSFCGAGGCRCEVLRLLVEHKAVSAVAGYVLCGARCGCVSVKVGLRERDGDG